VPVTRDDVLQLRANDPRTPIDAVPSCQPVPAWLVGAAMDPCATPPEPMPPLPGLPFLHRGAGAVIVGPTGGGRSSLVQAGLYDAARASLRAAYLGSEITEQEFNARAASLAQTRGDRVDDPESRSESTLKGWDSVDSVSRTLKPTSNAPESRRKQNERKSETT
jgi:hypothetical protein